MKRLVRLLNIFLLVALALGILIVPAAHQASAQTPPPPVPDVNQAITDAVNAQVSASQPKLLGFENTSLVVSNIIRSQDGRTALVWLAQRDPQTGYLIGREPALAIARNTTGLLARSADWSITIETADGFASALGTLPPDLVTDDLRQRYLSPEGAKLNVVQTFTGYRLPWSTALNIKITGSIGHFLDYNSCAEISCRYAYDFWNPDASNRMFPILASKGGIVKNWYDDCANNDHNCTNYIVLEDGSTSPVSYQLYYHIANNSVPANFVKGSTYVKQGEYIGNADNTGPSTASHLHFQVFTTPTNANYSWGYSVRIIFSDVHFNGGEPRTCQETIDHPSYGTECSVGPDGKKLTADDDYLQSENVGAYPPTAQLDLPFANTTFTDRIMNVSGSASDNLGITKVQVLANYNGAWNNLGSAPYANGVFVMPVDLCSSGIPDGPFSLAVRVFDVEGNWADRFTGLRQLFNNVSCGSVIPPPQPACSPLADEVALYSDANFQGACKKFTAGKYSGSQLGTVGEDNAESIQVGADVHAVLFDLSADLNSLVPQGRIETFTAADGNLADNLSGANHASALWVQSSLDQQDPSAIEPFLSFPGNRVDADGNSRTAPNPANPKSTDSLVLAWNGSRGGTSYDVKLEKPVGTVVASAAGLTGNTWSVGSLSAGDYTWTVTARNGVTTNSTSLAFTVDSAVLPTSGAATTPRTFDMEANQGDYWAGSGLWHWTDVKRLTGNQVLTSKAWIFNNTTNYADATYRAGDLTSPPIQIGATGAYYLRFKFYSDVEGASYANQTFADRFWDQRRVQLSVDNGAFKDLAFSPLTLDAQNGLWFWPSSPAVSLGSLNAGQSIRVRFHFDSVDPYNNTGIGWAVDDVTVNTVAPDTSCAETTRNDSLSTATAITLGTPITGASICPAGDVDYYRFSAGGGTPLKIDIDAKTLNPSSALDSFIDLLDANGNPIASNDDEQTGSLQDSQIITQLTLPGTNTYYLRVRAWDHPGAGGSAYKYNLSVGVNTATPVQPDWLAMSKPVNPQGIPVIPFIVEANVLDNSAGGGIHQVDFYWHSADWVNGLWVKFASDTTPGDGWWGIFNPTQDTTGSAFYIMATNNAGGVRGIFVPNLAPDNLPPTSAMAALPAIANSTAVRLAWTAQDTQNGMDHFEFQYRYNHASSWTTWPVQPGGSFRSAWFVGPNGPGYYDFQMRAVDNAGNIQAYPGVPQAAITLNGNCTDNDHDGTYGSAAQLVLGTTLPRGQCQNDVDWLWFNAAQGQDLLVIVQSLGGGASAHVRLYDSSGVNFLAESQSFAAGYGTSLRLKIPASGKYYLKIQPVDPGVYGSGVQYSVWAGTGYYLFLPRIGQ